MAPHLHPKPVLHHAREIEDMRESFQRSMSYRSEPPFSSYSSTAEARSESEASYRSCHTQPTDCSSPSEKAARQYHSKPESDPRYFPDRQPEESPRASTNSLASTTGTDVDENEDDDGPTTADYDIPKFYCNLSLGAARPPNDAAPTIPTTVAIPSTPADFSRLFPSRRRLMIRHDDSTPDGNLNLRVSTAVDLTTTRGAAAGRADMTLFHLRMHELRTRRFSLRRYHRDSGREVCHTSRVERPPSTAEHLFGAGVGGIGSIGKGFKRPAFQRSLSSALHAMRPRSDGHRTPTTGAAGGGTGVTVRPASFDLKRHDSGYASIRSVERDEKPQHSLQPPPPPSLTRPATSSGVDHDRGGSLLLSPQPPPLPPRQPVYSNTIRMEFTNYAQAEVRRTGGKASKRYEFSYWGTDYAWRRVLRRDGGECDVAYHLTKGAHDGLVLARMEPTVLTPDEAAEELARGGWVPPCSFWILDEGIISAQKDVSDVVVASGLMALVDDSIHTRFDGPRAKPASFSSRLGVDRFGPKRLVHDMLRNDAGSSRFPSLSRPATSGAATTAASSSDATHQSHSAARGMVRQLSSHV